MTTLQIKKIKDDYSKCANVKRVAFDNFVSEATVYRCIKNEVKPEGHKDNYMRKIAEEYLSGSISRKDIMQKYNISSSTLYYYLHKSKCK